MKNLKKIIGAMLTLSMNSAVNAAMYTPPPAPPAPAISPSAWAITIQALGANPNDLENVTVIETDNSTFTQGDNVTQKLDPDWSWGFNLGASYGIDTKHDIALNWTHFNNSSDPQSVFGNNINIYLGTAYLPDPAFADSWTSVTTSAENDLDQVNLELGRIAHFTQRMMMRFHAGLSYLRATQDITQIGAITGETNTFSSNSKFSGFGPRAGMSLEYLCGHGFSLVGGIAASLYVGNKDYDASFIDVLNGETSIANIDVDQRIIVPGSDAKLGIKYSHPSHSHGMFSIEGGYQIANYWDAVEDRDINGNPISDNFGYDGVYLGVTWSS